MGQQSLIYSFVARGTVILAEYTEFTGNFTGIAAQCLQKLPATNNKFTYNWDGHTFNYLVEGGFTYCVVAVESVGRQVPMAFLERIKEDFTKKYGGGKAATSVANSLSKEFGPKLKEQMQYCVDHPEEISKLAKVKAQVSEVKGVMMENIEKVLDRGEKIELLVDKTENLRSQDLRPELSNIEPKHEKEIASLISSYKALYNEWVFELRYGFGLLLYGFGSKKTLIEDFASTTLTEYSVIVVNGYLPSINFKQVAMAMAEVLWDQLKLQPRSASGGLTKSQQPFNSRSMDDLIAFLDGPHAQENECFVCLVIHNIDGPGLRDSESQHLLARIAACSHVRVVASIDHINAPLLWDKKMVHIQFNWCWHHVPTFAPYKVEGVFHPLILAHGSASQSVKTATIVLQSLTPNAQSVFKVLAEHQVAHPDDEGMPIDVLFTNCRERFLVSSLVTLNSHLTEFKDHILVKIRRHSDGQDCFYIPLPKDALEKLVQEINQ